MTNDTDPDGDPLQFEVVGAPQHGAVASLDDGFLAFDPEPDYSTRGGDQAGGTWVSDTISYRVFDGKVYSNTASYKLWIAPVNDAPSFKAGGDVTVNEDSGPFSATWATSVSPGPGKSDQVVDFIVDPVGDPSLFAISPAISSSGVLTFTPAVGRYGLSTVTVRAHDDGGLQSYPGVVVTPVDTSASRTFTIAVNPVNDAPVANDQSITTDEDIAAPITLTGSDAEGSDLAYLVIAGPAHGTLTGLAPNLTYTPAANHNGSDSFTFRVNDGTVDSATASVSITVTPVNDPPVCSPLVLGTDKNVPVGGTVTCTDVDGPNLALRIGNGPGRGMVAPSTPPAERSPTRPMRAPRGGTASPSSPTTARPTPSRRSWTSRSETTPPSPAPSR